MESALVIWSDIIWSCRLASVCIAFRLAVPLSSEVISTRLSFLSVTLFSGTNLFLSLRSHPSPGLVRYRPEQPPGVAGDTPKALQVPRPQRFQLGCPHLLGTILPLD